MNEAVDSYGSRIENDAYKPSLLRSVQSFKVRGVDIRATVYFAAPQLVGYVYVFSGNCSGLCLY